MAAGEGAGGVSAQSSVSSLGSASSTTKPAAGSGSLKPQPKPGITFVYESGDEDDDDLVENIDLDFSVRSPWMTDVFKAAAAPAT